MATCTPTRSCRSRASGAARPLRTAPRLAAGANGWAGTEGFDGVAMQWYRSLDDFIQGPTTRVTRRRSADEGRLLDLAGGVYLLTGEPRIVIED